MTEIVPFQPAAPRGSSLELAPEAWKLASRVADTDFVPKALRGKPEAVLACILAGHEAGISPMQSLSKIHVVDGRPAMSAELMRALVLRAGHEIWVEEQSSTRVILKGQRAGSERVSTVTWTMDDAKRANLSGKQNWRSYPTAMLLARATSELCRMIFPDVLAGISHTIEEIGDLSDDVDPIYGAPEVVPPKAHEPARATAKARQASTAEPGGPDTETIDVAPPPNRGDVPPLPGEEVLEDESDIVDAEVVEPSPEEENPEVVEDEFGETESDADGPADLEPVVEDEWPQDDDPPPPEPAPRVTGAQMPAIRFNEAGITDRAERLRRVVAIIGREITSTNQLTSEEISAVVRWLDQYEPDTAPAHGSDPDLAEATDVPGVKERRTAVTPPEEWTGDRWREFLRQRKIKVGPALAEARKLGAAYDPPLTFATLDDIAGSPISGELIGWIEEQTP